MKKTRKIDVFNQVVYFVLILLLSFFFTKAGLIDLIGNDTHIEIGKFTATVKLKWLLFL